MFYQGYSVIFIYGFGDNRLIGIRSNWEPTIRIVKIAIRFSTKINIQTLKSVCEDLGVPLAPEKQAGPSTNIEFLGIVIDTVKQELQLPKDKLHRLIDTVRQWESRKSCTQDGSNCSGTAVQNYSLLQ